MTTTEIELQLSVFQVEIGKFKREMLAGFAGVRYGTKKKASVRLNRAIKNLSEAHSILTGKVIAK